MVCEIGLKTLVLENEGSPACSGADVSNGYDQSSVIRFEMDRKAKLISSGSLGHAACSFSADYTKETIIFVCI